MDNFTAVYKKDGDWWVGYVEELPGAHTQGRTLDEARENLKEGTRLNMDANHDIAMSSHHGGDDALARRSGNSYGTAEISESGVDLSQLRRNLRLTPTQRVSRMVEAARFFASIHGIARASQRVEQ